MILLELTVIEIWAIGFAGWLIYNLFQLQSNLHLFDLDNNGLSGSELLAYFRKHSISIIISFVVTALIVYFHWTEDLWYLIMSLLGKEIGFIEPFHALPSVVAPLIQKYFVKNHEK
jgi:hypothetical protein